MLTNAVGPIFMYKYFEHLIGKSQRKTLINVASNFGSITLAQKPLKDKKQRGPLDNHQIVYKVIGTPISLLCTVRAHGVSMLTASDLTCLLSVLFTCCF